MMFEDAESWIKFFIGVLIGIAVFQIFIKKRLENWLP